jgi:hypothetical protein
MSKKISPLMVIGSVIVSMSCGLEASPAEPHEPGLDGIWVATSWVVADKLAAPRFVSDGAGGMREVPRQFNMIADGGSVILTIKLDGTYSRQSVFPNFPSGTGSEVGTFILVDDQLQFLPSDPPSRPVETVLQVGDDMNLASLSDQWDFDEDGTFSLQEEATITKAFRRSN